jgi:acetylornithine aminotransferase
VAEVRGRGLFLGVGLSAPIAPEVARLALADGVLVNAIGLETLRLVPPLVISDDDIELAVSVLGWALGRAAGALA